MLIVLAENLIHTAHAACRPPADSTSAAGPGPPSQRDRRLNATRQAGATLGVAAMGALAGTGTATGSAYALLLSAGICAAAGTWFARAAGGQP